ncbi:MAG: hypothetical protein ACRDZ8_16640 [Acidimicrobiales bacterium]
MADLETRLQQLASGSQPTPPPIEVLRRRAARRRVRRVLAITVGAGLGLSMAIVAARVWRPGSASTEVATGQPTTAVPSPGDVRIMAGRFVASVELDGGALRIDPTAATPQVSEQHAIATFRAGTPPDTFTQGVVVGFGSVTIATNLTTGNTPRFTHQASWVVFYSEGPLNCPAIAAASASPQPAPTTAFILSASTTAVDYTGRGSVCGEPPRGPTVATASIYQSVPWTPVAENGATATVGYTAPPCGTLVTVSANAQPVETPVVEVLVEIPLDTIACPPSRPATATFRLATPDVVLLHGPTGAVTGRFTGTGPDEFTYYDGVLRTTP